MARQRSTGICAALVLLAAMTIRVVLAARGGQFYSSDEYVHFTPALAAADALGRGEWDAALVALIQQEHHMGFRLSSALVAVTGRLIAPGQLELTACLLASASVAVILLVYALARRLGAPREEALLAMLFAATATSLTYFSRHLMPYDTGLALDLLALWLALRVGGFGRAVAVGAVACLGFLTYYAYLAVAAVAGAVHVLRTRAGVGRRLAGVALGAAAVFACFEIATVTRGATIPWVLPFHVMLWRFLHGAPESWGSSYAEGWWVPGAYLWHVEHLVVVVWVALIIVGCVIGTRRARQWGAIAVGLYAWMVLHSTVLGESVVLGRFVRQVVPFLCLGAAAGLADALARLRRRGGWRARRHWWAIGVAVYAGAVILNLWPVFAQRFPRDLDRRWRAAHGPLAYDQTLLGPDGTAGTGRYVAFNVRMAGPPWPVVGVRDEPLPGCVIEAYPHPLAWPGYQYEGYTEAGRAAVRAQPYLMALVEQQPTAPCAARTR